jgi:hypothetical protein
MLLQRENTYHPYRHIMISELQQGTETLQEVILGGIQNPVLLFILIAFPTLQ